MNNCTHSLGMTLFHGSIFPALRSRHRCRVYLLMVNGKPWQMQNKKKIYICSSLQKITRFAKRIGTKQPQLSSTKRRRKTRKVIGRNMRTVVQLLIRCVCWCGSLRPLAPCWCPRFERNWVNRGLHKRRQWREMLSARLQSCEEVRL